MARRRKSTIGASPLDAVVPHSATGEAAGANSGVDGVPVEARRAQERLDGRSRRTGGARKERLTVHVPAGLSDRVKDAVYWTPGLTLARLAERALSAEMEKLETERGEPFPERAEELRGGRPVK